MASGQPPPKPWPSKAPPSSSPTCGSQPTKATAAIPAHARDQHIRAHAADEAARRIHELGGRAATWEADLADPATVPALFDRAEAALGPVEVLVNNADHCDPDTLRPSQMTPERSSSGTPVRTFTDRDGVNHRYAAYPNGSRRDDDQRFRWSRLCGGPART
jgi:NAD(P)-dependent dehydrogenase (short-subunit alcohol dehydrogenase family)